MSKRGQGLSIEFIVTAAIAVLVLMLIVGFATGAFKGLFQKAGLLEVATGDEITAYMIECRNACFEAKQTVRSESAWTGSKYCRTSKKNIDTNYDSVLNASDDSEVHCWEKPLFVSCEGVAFSAGGVDYACKTPAQNDICKAGDC
jgi:hypothetical protein